MTLFDRAISICLVSKMTYITCYGEVKSHSLTLTVWLSKPLVVDFWCW